MNGGKDMARGTKVVMAALLLAWAGAAEGVTVFDVQHSDAAAGWGSAYADQVVSVTGGVVTFVGLPPGKKTARVVVQDPAFAEWGGVEIKVLEGTFADVVRVGDRVDLAGVYVDESSKGRGTTYLLYDDRTPAEGGYGSSFTVLGSGFAVAATVVSPSLLGAGDVSADPAAAERYEGMLLEVRDVVVGALYQGSHNDNYELIGAGGTCWASDYMNLDRPPSELYHPDTVTGRALASVVGILEQYTHAGEGYDYYQLLTLAPREADEAAVPEPAASALLSAGVGTIILRRRRHPSD